MKFVFGIFSLVIATIEARGAPKIEIFEIRENDNGLQLKNLNSNPRISNQRADSLIKLLRVPKTDNQATRFAKQLLSKLKSLKGEEKSTRYSDDAHIYILNSDVLDDDSYYDDGFIDETRNERNDVDKNHLREILMQLAQFKKTKKLWKAVKSPALRTSNVIIAEDRTMVPIHKRKYETDSENHEKHDSD